MRSSKFAKLSGAVLITALVVLASIGGSTLAGPLPQATATLGATSSAGGAGTTSQFAPCPPTTSATASATMAATSAAAATMAGTLTAQNPGYIGIRVEL